jgi:hypothetical protein
MGHPAADTPPTAAQQRTGSAAYTTKDSTPAGLCVLLLVCLSQSSRICLFGLKKIKYLTGIVTPVDSF